MFPECPLDIPSVFPVRTAELNVQQMFPEFPPTFIECSLSWPVPRRRTRREGTSLWQPRSRNLQVSGGSNVN
jgi:hypothetical protein